MVLLHGVGTNRTIWDASVPALSRHRAVTTVDLPGFGDSPAPGEWTLDAVAEEIADTLETDLGTGFDLVGSSLGGAVALTLAARRPALVERLVLVSPAGFRPAPAPIARAVSLLAGPVIGARRFAGLRLAERRTARRALLAGTVADGAALDPDAARLMLRASATAAALRPALLAATTADLGEIATDLERPMGLIWGSLDRVVPAHTAERVLALRPDTPIEIVPATGHVPHLEAPASFVAALERVLSQLP